MKKLTICLISLTLLSAVPLLAQIKIGPRVGINSSWVQVDERFNYDGETVSYETEGATVGFHIGAFGRLALGPVYVQPEILFTSCGGRIAVESDSKARDIQRLTYNKIDAPVMVGFKMAKVLRVQAGPVFTLNLSGGARDIDAFEQAEQNYTKSTIGYQAGIGFDIGDLLVIDIKYEGNLNKFGDSLQIGDESFSTDMRNSMLMVVVGYNLL